jgi:hypothetical protein
MHALETANRKSLPEAVHHGISQKSNYRRRDSDRFIIPVTIGCYDVRQIIQVEKADVVY